MRINPQTRTLRRPPPKKPAIVASTMAKKKAAKVAATKTLDALKNVVKTKVNQNKKPVVLTKKLNISPKKLPVTKKATVKKAVNPKARPKKIVQKKVVQEPKKKVPIETKLPTEPNRISRAKNIKHKVVVTIVENQSDLFARDDVVTVKEFSKRGNSPDKAHSKNASPVRNEIIKKIAQKVINTKPKNIPKLIKNVSKTELGKNHTVTKSRTAANDKVKKTKLQNKQLKSNKDKIIVSELKPIEVKNEIKLTKDLIKNEEINKTMKSPTVDIDIDRVKRETIEKLLREANESLSKKPNKKKKSNRKSKNKTKSNAEQAKKSDIKTAVNIVDTNELKLESGNKNTTEVPTSKGLKEIKQSNKKLKESAEIIKQKTQPTTLAPQSVKKVIKENVVQKQSSTTDTVANKGKISSTKQGEKQCKSEMKTNDEDSSTSDEITLDLVRQNHLNEIKPEVLNSAGKQQLNAGTAKKKLVKDSVDSHPESSSSDDSKNKTLTKSQQKQKGKNIVTKNNVKVKPKMVVVKKRVLKNSKVKNKDLEHEQRARRMKLFGFWSGPKRHRVASLNALAKVHCLYENESRGLFELLKRRKSSSGDNKTNSESESTNVPSPPTRTLRSGPGMRGVGKHWEHNASFSSSEESSSGHESSVESNDKLLTPPPSYKQKQKEVAETKKVVKKPNKVVNKADTVKKKRNRTEIMMDLKDMVVRKRMASLNATAILAASYSAEKRPGKTDTDDSDETDLDSDVSSLHPSDSKRRCYESDVKEEEDRKVIEVHTTPNNKKVAVIVNQDTDVTITGVYVNSTTRSTHHEGYCSIAGMQYRISATSHTQTAATAVATETLLHPVPPPTSQAQQSPPQQASEHISGDQSSLSSSCKSYTPLSALSNMQPPGAPSQSSVAQQPQQQSQPPHSTIVQPDAVSPLLSAGRRHGCTSAFSAPPPGQYTVVPPPPPPHVHPVPPPHAHLHHHHHHHHGHHPPPPPIPGAKVEHPPPGYVHGYYQPAGPLISAHHAAPAHVVGPPPASVQPGSGGGNTGSGKTAPLPSLEASPTSTPPLPSSVGGESSDNDITVTTGVASDSSQQPPPQPPQPTATYRYSQSYPPPSGGHAPPGYSPYYAPTQYYASPPSAGSLQYPQQQHYHHQDLCYSTTSYPPATHFYHKAATYGTPPPPGSFTRRYIGPPTHYYTSSNPSDLYASSQNAQQSSQVVTAGSAASTGATYQPPPGGPPPPTLVETYPAPPPGSVSIVDPYPPPPPYYSGYSAGPAPACYTHGHSPPTRSLAFIDTAYQSCPCPMQSCPKNVHTGPLTGDGKRSNMTSIAKETGLSLPPVALALPLEPASVIGPPSPARGSAGMPPPPSPAGATYQQSTTPKWDAKQEEGSNETLITESKTADKVRRKARVGKTMARNSLANNFNSLQKQTNNTMLLMCHNADTNNDISMVKREAISSDDEVVILEERRKVNISELPSTQVDEKTVPQITQHQSEEPKTEDVNERLSPLESESKKDIVLHETDSKIDNDRTIPVEEKKSDKSDENVITSAEENKEAKPQNGKKRKLTLDDIDEKILEVQKKQKILKNTSSYKDLIRKNTKIITKLNNGRQKLNVPLETKSRILISKTPKITLSSKSNKKPIVKRTASQCKDEPVAKKVKSSKPLAASSLHNSKQNVRAIKPTLDNSKLSENKEPLKKMLNKKNIKKTSNVLNCLLTAKNNVDRTIESVITYSVSIVDSPVRTDITDLLKDSCVKKEEAPKTVPKKDNLKNIVVKKDEVIKGKKENINCIKKDEVLKNLNVKKENLLKCVENEENLKNMCASKEKEDILKCNPVKKLEVLKSNSINKKEDLKKLKNTVAIKKDSLKSTIDKKTNSKNLDQNSKSKVGNNKQTKVLAVNKIVNKKKNKTQEVIPAVIPRVPRRSLHAPRWSNGWSWEGEPFEGKVFLNSDEAVVARKCYPAMRHLEGDVVTPRDCVLLKSGPRKIDLPFVAKVAALWENPDDGEMMMSLLWYYRPEHTEQGRLPSDQPDEVFASRHKDTNSVACIEDKCYVLTYSEYCRYRKNMKRLEEGIENPCRIVPVLEGFWRAHRQPPSEQPTSPELVMFCRRVYDFRQKRIVKNPGG